MRTQKKTSYHWLATKTPVNRQLLRLLDLEVKWDSQSIETFLHFHLTGAVCNSNFLHNCQVRFIFLITKATNADSKWQCTLYWVWSVMVSNSDLISSADDNYYNFIPGHKDEHGTRCRVSPMHGAPPLTGFGLLHVRVRLWYPFPHTLLHSFHTPHEDQPPFTAIGSKLHLF